jgi:hypothetical protein
MDLPYIASYAFCQLGKEGAPEYLAKFVRTLPSRIDFLTKNIRSTPGFKSWHATRDLESLLELSRWLRSVAKLCRPTKKQLEMMIASTPPSIRSTLDTSNPVPTLETELIARDVGSYCALMIADRLPTSWGFVDKPKDSVDLWMPVLFYEPKTKISGYFSPLNVGTVLAIKAAENDLSEQWLSDAFAAWTVELPPKPQSQVSKARVAKRNAKKK